MFRPRPRSGHPHLFSSAKTAAPIPARHPALREALVLASLDPAVRAISHFATAHVGSSQVAVEIDAVVLTRDHGRVHLDVVPARRVRDLDTEGLVQIALRELDLHPVVVTAEDLRTEPRRSNARLVWSYKDRQVPVPLRLNILKIVAVSKRRERRPNKSAGTVLIDQVYDRKLGKFDDGDDGIEIDDNFVLAPEEDAAEPGGDRPEAVTAVVGATFEAATTADQRRRLRHGQAMCVIVHVPSPAWVVPVSLYARSAIGERWLQHTRHGPGPGERCFSTSSASVSLALSAGQSVVGIAADPDLLPRALIGAAGMKIRLAPPTRGVEQLALVSPHRSSQRPRHRTWETTHGWRLRQEQHQFSRARGQRDRRLGGALHDLDERHRPGPTLPRFQGSGMRRPVRPNRSASEVASSEPISSGLDDPETTLSSA